LKKAVCGNNKRKGEKFITKDSYTEEMAIMFNDYHPQTRMS
jgi:hypothetical protein